MLTWKRNPVDYLYKNIDIDSKGCWNFLGSINYNGYGLTKYSGRRRSVHRLSWMIYNGPIPDGKHICHHCDNKKCINPKHLYCGTHADNMKDVTARKRHPKHLSVPVIQKITLHQMEDIKDYFMVHGISAIELGRIYGVSRRSIYGIVWGKVHRQFV